MSFSFYCPQAPISHVEVRECECITSEAPEADPRCSSCMGSGEHKINRREGEFTLPKQETKDVLEELGIIRPEEDLTFGKINCPDKLSELIKKTIWILNTNNPPVRDHKGEINKGATILEGVKTENIKTEIKKVQGLLVQAREKGWDFIWC